MKANDLKALIRDIPDFPSKGIIFKDITPLLGNPEAFRKSIDLLARKFKDQKITKVVSVESRGFIFGSALAYKLKAGVVPVRKKGKLPYKTRGVTYQLEYGTDTLEMHEDALTEQDRVLIVDDVLATGGTVSAVVELVKGARAPIAGVVFLIELKFLKGKAKLKDTPMAAIIRY
ncbi:MAG: adenine phosphoribosyltransferase [Candidatus Omnitrophota bacterium]|nr:adenine phosphoribosyltransferase [Candidatus Omnitrophota bacterium]MDZ4241293.1 adenine phosphoribosyltransferase [Candidatus Omnitrophota bacterium]